MKLKSVDNRIAYFEVNKKCKWLIKIHFQVEIWDTKENYINFFKWIIKELENFK